MQEANKLSGKRILMGLKNGHQSDIGNDDRINETCWCVTGCDRSYINVHGPYRLGHRIYPCWCGDVRRGDAGRTGNRPDKTPQAQLAEFGGVFRRSIGYTRCNTDIFRSNSVGNRVCYSRYCFVWVSEAVMQENGITTKIQTFLKENEALIVGVSTALLILGIILLFTPAALSLALGLIAAGAVGLATEAVLNWSYIKDTMENFFTEHAAWIATVSGMLLIMGIILIVTAVNVPLGIAMVIGGITGIVAEVVLNWDYIKDTMEKSLQNIKELIISMSAALLILGIVLILTGMEVCRLVSEWL